MMSSKGSRLKWKLAVNDVWNTSPLHTDAMLPAEKVEPTGEFGYIETGEGHALAI